MNEINVQIRDRVSDEKGLTGKDLKDYEKLVKLFHTHTVTADNKYESLVMTVSDKVIGALVRYQETFLED